jgi:uncharacterized protein (DUF302 family)/uncharacterized damage-inducible protein DinB
MAGESVVSGRPQPGEYADYGQPDIDRVAGDDAVAALAAQRAETAALFRSFGEAGADLTYASGKWTVKQVLGHLADDERIYAYRALCIARGDTRELPGFDENAYAAAARFEARSFEDLLSDYEAVRAASLTLLRGLDREVWLRRGIANGYPVTVRGLAFHIAGHELHHLAIVRERYLPLVGNSSGGGSAVLAEAGMFFIVESAKPFERASSDLEAAVARQGFGVLKVHDLGRTLRSRGVPFAEECRIFEVCNPERAATVLSADMRLNMALPCRISVYTENGRTKMGLIEPVPMLSALSEDPTLASVARDVQEAIHRMVEEAK